jgi:hypothetical protein
MHVRQRKSTVGSKGRRKKSFDAAFGTSFRITELAIFLRKQKHVLNLFSSFPRQPKILNHLSMYRKYYYVFKEIFL